MLRFSGADNYEVVCEFYRTTHDRETKRTPLFCSQMLESGQKANSNQPQFPTVQSNEIGAVSVRYGIS